MSTGEEGPKRKLLDVNTVERMSRCRAIMVKETEMELVNLELRDRSGHHLDLAVFEYILALRYQKERIIRPILT